MKSKHCVTVHNNTSKLQVTILSSSEMIKDFDLDVKIAEGGKEAIDIIDSFTPDIILLDLMMPRVNGWDVIEHVREKYSKNGWLSSLFPC